MKKKSFILNFYSHKKKIEKLALSVSLKFLSKLWQENDDAVVFPASARVLTITDCALRDSTIASQKSTSARSKLNELESYRS